MHDIIQQNLSNVQQDIAAACQRAGRQSSDVRLVAVTKYAEWQWVETLKQYHTTFGENRPQQLAERHVLLPDVDWHLIGQLQRNKVKLAVQHAVLIHSVDSLSLLQRVASVSQQLEIRARVLLQVNVSGEDSKSGFSKDELRTAWTDIVNCHQQVEVAGLMTMAAACEDPEDARGTFRELATLRDEFADSPEAAECGITLPQLSMGMSGDFSVAVEEGATLVRVGSRLFEGL